MFAGCGTRNENSSDVTAAGMEGTSSSDTTASAAPKENVTLQFWGGVPAESGPQEVCDNFNKEFASQGIKIEYTRFVNDAQGNLKLDTSLMAGSDIDVYMTYFKEYLVKRATANMALDLSELVTKDNYDLVDKFGEVVKETTYIDGKPYGIPTKVENACFLLNKDMFDAAGIPIPESWTFEEFRDTAKKLTKGEGQNKVYGCFVDSNFRNNTPYQFANTKLGGDGVYKSGGKETNFDAPEFGKALQVLVDMMFVDQSMPTQADAITEKLDSSSMFLNGKAAMVLASWIVRDVKDLNKYPHTFVTAFAPAPVFSKSDEYYSSGGPGDNICINPKSKHIDEVWTFIKWYAEKGMTPMAKYGRIPLYKDFSKEVIASTFLQGSEKLFDSESFTRVFITPVEKYQVSTIITAAPEILKITQEEYDAALYQKKSVDDAMASLKTRADAALKAALDQK